MDWSGSGVGQVTGSYEHGYECSNFHKMLEVLYVGDQVSVSKEGINSVESASYLHVTNIQS